MMPNDAVIHRKTAEFEEKNDKEKLQHLLEKDFLLNVLMSQSTIYREIFSG